MRQVSKSARRDYDAIVNDIPTEVTIPGTRRTVRIYGIKPYTIECLTRLWLRRDMKVAGSSADELRSLCEEPYFSVKEASLFVLNGYYRIKLLYPILWRIWGRLRGYTDEQMSPIIQEGKKKTSAHGTLDEYGILGGYEERLDEADEEGSRAIPSRTALGDECSFCKDFPEYGRGRVTLFGWERHWAYRTRLTLPQIELMQSDLPHTLYKGRKKDEPSKADVESDPAYRLTLESIERARLRRESDPNRETTIEEIFGDGQH